MTVQNLFNSFDGLKCIFGIYVGQKHSIYPIDSISFIKSSNAAAIFFGFAAEFPARSGAVLSAAAWAALRRATSAACCCEGCSWRTKMRRRATERMRSKYNYFLTMKVKERKKTCNQNNNYFLTWK